MTENKQSISNCCKNGSEVIFYFQKRKEYYLQYAGQDWWVIINYCPWCGKKLDGDKTQEWKPHI